MTIRQNLTNIKNRNVYGTNGMTKEYVTSWRLYICGKIDNDRGQYYEDQAK